MSSANKSFSEQFSATALALGWQNRHSSQDRLIRDSQDPEKLAGVEITLGRYAKSLSGCDGLTLVVRATERLGAKKTNFQFHLERHDKGVEPAEISSQEDDVAQAAMQEFVDKYAELAA